MPNKPPDTPEEDVELNEGDIEIVDAPASKPFDIDPSQFYTSAPSVPPRDIKPLEQMMKEYWTHCEIIFPNEYPFDEKTIQALARQCNFRASVFGKKVTLMKNVDSHLINFLNRYLLEGTKITIVFYPFKKSFTIQ